jgi:hypothetical protein
VVLAARGARNLDDGERKVDDENSAAVLKRRARRLHAWSFLVALLLMVIAIFIIGEFNYSFIFADK